MTEEVNNTYNNYSPWLILTIIAVALLTFDHLTGWLTQQHIKNAEYIAFKHKPGHPLYESAIDELITYSTATEEWKKEISAHELGMFGHNATRALPYLEILKHDNNIITRQNANQSIMKIQE